MMADIKARLVADGCLTADPVESIDSEVVSLRNLRLVFFLGKLNSGELILAMLILKLLQMKSYILLQDLNLKIGRDSYLLSPMHFMD